MEKDLVILVDIFDRHTGEMEKMEAHRKGLLHRAFSVFIFNEEGKMLLQKRAAGKYHSANLWTNACCSHPRPGESLTDAVSRRMKEEMGFVAPVEKIFDFLYQAEFENGIRENEYDHVFCGVFNGPVIPNPEEVSEYVYMDMNKLAEAVFKNPGHYTVWFRRAFPQVAEWWSTRFRLTPKTH